MCLALGWKTKMLLKTKHQGTFVYIMNFTHFCPFWGIFAALRPSFSNFLHFLSAVQKYVLKDVIHTVI